MNLVFFIATAGVDIESAGAGLEFLSHYGKEIGLAGAAAFLGFAFRPMIQTWFHITSEHDKDLSVELAVLKEKLLTCEAEKAEMKANSQKYFDFIEQRQDELFNSFERKKGGLND